MELGSGSSESSTVEQLVVVTHDDDDDDHNQMVGIEGCDESSELELGLGLSLGSSNKTHHLHHHHKIDGVKHQIPRILTAKDLGVGRNGGGVSPPSSASSCSSLGLNPPSKSPSNFIHTTNVSAGSKRAVSPTAVSQVVGWPPIRSYRMASMANQAKSVATGEHSSQFDECNVKDKGNVNYKDRVTSKSSLFVKVNMDGVGIGRKVDLTLHSGYESLAQTLEDMFTNIAAEKSNTEELILMPKATRPSRLLDGLSEYVLTYEDKDGDWMLVGDVPWGMFVGSVKRLKIMRTSEANGLAPRSEDRRANQRSRPI